MKKSKELSTLGRYEEILQRHPALLQQLLLM
jgi:hypothetical protein